MSAGSNKVAIRIDDASLQVDSKLTILQAAEQNDIYIPTLCSFEGLTPYGGCRMCIVEVEGMRGFPTACTTPVNDGMEILYAHDGFVAVNCDDCVRTIELPNTPEKEKISA